MFENKKQKPEEDKKQKSKQKPIEKTGMEAKTIRVTDIDKFKKQATKNAAKKTKNS